MTKSELDPERLAALLDGRLTPGEREAVLARLADSPDELEILADAAAATEALEEEDPQVVPLRRPRRWAAPRWMAVAAAVAGVGFLSVLAIRSGGGDPDPVAGFVGLLEAPRAGLPPGWEQRPWGTVRGADDPMTPAQRSARLGVVLVDLEVAARAGSADVRPLALESAALLEGIAGAGPVAATYRAAAATDDPRQRAELLATGRAAVAGLVDRDRFELAAWAEGARIAAARRDAGYFTSRESRGVLERAAALAWARPAVPALISATQGDPVDWPRVTESVTSLQPLIWR